MGPGGRPRARRATGQHKNVVILVSSHDGIKTDIEEHQPACENISNIDVDLIRQPEAQNWPTVGGGVEGNEKTKLLFWKSIFFSEHVESF